VVFDRTGLAKSSLPKTAISRELIVGMCLLGRLGEGELKSQSSEVTRNREGETRRYISIECDLMINDRPNISNNRIEMPQGTRD
jgi:hypothetical protein